MLRPSIEPGLTVAGKMPIFMCDLIHGAWAHRARRSVSGTPKSLTLEGKWRLTGNINCIVDNSSAITRPFNGHSCG